MYSRSASQVQPESLETRTTDDADLYHRLLQECLDNGTLYEDPTFPAIDASIYKSVPFLKKGYPQWRRPKVICDNPQFVVSGASRLDLHQGDLGNCWFVAAASLLTGAPDILEQVMPQGQGFSASRYAGIFRFRFWLYGEWKEVIIDDRLPVNHKTGELIFGYNRDQPHEFWFPLLEKAYAKLYGSYEGLRGGKLIDALVDLTAGAGRIVPLQSTEVPKGLFRMMFKLQKVNTLMGCSIHAGVGNTIVQKLDNGLYAGHAYSITKMSKISCGDSMVKLIRLRNPWGKVEWNGKFSDGSEMWANVCSSDREALEIRNQKEGEFWMEFEEWKSIFSELQICYMTPDSPLHTQDKSNWRVLGISHGAWETGKTAGGSMEEFNKNPQFDMNVGAGANDATDGGNNEVLVSVMQKSPIITASGSARYASWNALKRIAYAVYKLADGTQMNTPLISPYREVCDTHVLPAGSYRVIPYTQSPNQEADFLIRILEM